MISFKVDVSGAVIEIKMCAFSRVICAGACFCLNALLMQTVDQYWGTDLFFLLWNLFMHKIKIKYMHAYEIHLNYLAN